MISIIIPHHYEDKEKIKPLMVSINSQIGIDFNNIEILLCSDVDISPIDTIDFTEYENICSRIRKIKSPFKNNIGLSRQAGLDEALGDYVVFCDADDCLYNIGVLRELEENINKTHADVYRFRFLEEIGESGTKERSYIIKNFNWTWVFSKAYRTEFIRLNNIRFSKELNYHEDSYFNFILRYRNPKVVDIDSSPSYLWRYSDNSITRVNNHEYSFASWNEFIFAITLGVRNILGSGKQVDITELLDLSVQTYILLINPVYNSFDEKKRYRVEKQYYEFLLEFLSEYLFKEDIDRYVLQKVTQIFFRCKPGFIPKISWEDHIHYIFNKFNNK